MLQQGVKAFGNLRFPQRPIVVSRAGVKFKLEITILQPPYKAQVGLKEPLLLSDRDVYIWSLIGTRRPHEHKWIV